MDDPINANRMIFQSRCVTSYRYQLPVPDRDQEKLQPTAPPKNEPNQLTNVKRDAMMQC